MSTRTLNLGVLAHVDAGKTSLTERLLFDHGAIARLGTVDEGSTQTDSGEVERRRGITIRSAVACFALGDLQVNLVDTPGHPDFIAEVERALSVLDAAVLVISAVEGVQAQTRVLMRSLRCMHLPTLILVNKIDRRGAREADLVTEIRKRLAVPVVAMQQVSGLGTAGARTTPRSFDDPRFGTEVAELLADHDDALLGRLVDGTTPPGGEDLRALLEEQTRAGLVHPVHFGSALSGAGITEITQAVRGLLPGRGPATDGAVRGTVFAIERSRHGEKIAYLRLFSGELGERQRVTLRRRGPGGAVEEHSGRIAGLEVVGAASTDDAHPGPGVLGAGSIARLRGLPHVRVGDQLGEPDASRPPMRFSPPILESIVRPRRLGAGGALHAALTRLADEDPLIRTRTAGGGATSVLLYGAVQQEVLAERLEREFGIAAAFEQATPVYLERPAGAGDAVWEFDPRGPNDFWQTVGLRVELAPLGTGNTFTRRVQAGLLPRGYHRAIEDAAMATLAQGLHGWGVTDCSVALTRVGYDPPMSSAADFRHLTPIVLMQALQTAGSEVYEPGHTVEVEAPDDALSGVLRLLGTLDADIAQTALVGSAWTIRGQIPARSLQDLVIALPGLTHGEGSLWYELSSDRRVRGPVPHRQRLDGNPLDHDEYLRYLSNPSIG